MKELKSFLVSAFDYIMTNYASSDVDSKVIMNSQMIDICQEMAEIDAELSSEMEARFRRMANV